MCERLLMMSYHLKTNFLYESYVRPMPVAAQSKACVCGRSFSGIVGSNFAEGLDVLSLLNFVCCQVEVSATSWSLVYWSCTLCGVFEFDLETSRVRNLRPTRVVEPWRVVGQGSPT
jgi:hypothetical protein